MFAVFAFDDYYPCGGWNDHIASVPTLKKAHKKVAKSKARAWAPGHHQIVNLLTGEVVWYE